MTQRLLKLSLSVARGEGRNPELQDLRARAGVRAGEAGLAAVQHEILQEMAQSYARSQQRVEEAFRRLGELQEQIDALGDARPAAAQPDREQLARAFNQQRHIARERRWELMVHREAICSARHTIREDYPLPPVKKLSR